MNRFSTPTIALLALLPILSGIPAAAQHSAPIEPLRLPGLDNQLYVGAERTAYDYGLRTAITSPIARARTYGINLQYGYRKMDHLSFIGTVRYGQGALLAQNLTTTAAGVGYVVFFRRYEPFLQLMGGYSRLRSNHAAGNIFLKDTPITGFTTLFGGGLDVTLSPHWGIRPLYLENQYLPFGSKRSVYWNAGAGLLFRFNTSRRQN